MYKKSKKEKSVVIVHIFLHNEMQQSSIHGDIKQSMYFYDSFYLITRWLLNGQPSPD